MLIFSRKSPWRPKRDSYAIRYSKSKIIAKLRGESPASKQPRLVLQDISAKENMAVKANILQEQETVYVWATPKLAEKDANDENEMDQLNLRYYDDETVTATNSILNLAPETSHVEIDYDEIHHASRCDNDLNFCPFQFVSFLLTNIGQNCQPDCTNPFHAQNLGQHLQNRSCEHVCAFSNFNSEMSE